MAVTRDGRPSAGRRSDRFTTSDPGHAAEVIRDSYRVTGGVRIFGDTDRFRFSQEVLTGRGFAATRFQCTSGVGYHGPLGGVLCVEQVHSGRLSFTTAGGELRAGGGDVCLVPPHEPWRATTDEIDLAPLVLDQAGVASYAAATCGIQPDSLTFTGLEPVSPVAAQHWNATVAHVRDHILGAPEIADAPLVRAEAFRMLAGAVLTLFPNNALAALTERPGVGTQHVDPAVIRRAVEFIDDNAHRPIGLAEIAEAARVGARALQQAFRRHRDCTPLEYLKQVRLEHAHRDLLAADPTGDDTVAAIAARWGMTHPGRFSVEYRTRYGCLPSRTLRR